MTNGGGDPVVILEDLHIRVRPEIRRLVEESLVYPETLNDVIHRILAKHFGRPDLEEVPRKRMGRPSKKHIAARSGKTNGKVHA